MHASIQNEDNKCFKDSMERKQSDQMSSYKDLQYDTVPFLFEQCQIAFENYEIGSNKRRLNLKNDKGMVPIKMREKY